MNDKKSANFVKELPEGYKEAFHISATDKKGGLLLTLGSMLFYAIAIVVEVILFNAIVGPHEKTWQAIWIGILVSFAPMLLYIVLHELVHGAAYKAFTGEKLTFGMIRSCAFCGVPNIYVYRKCFIISCLAPFVIFSVIFTALMAVCLVLLAKMPESLYALTVVYTAISALATCHFGGCVGDLFISALMIFKYRRNDSLMRDTGPEQFVYVKIDQSEESL